MLYTIDISKTMGREYVPVCEDIVRMLLIQITIQTMFYLSATDRSFLTDEFILLVMYIILGVCLYWLVFRSLVKFV
jgi:hypothetical protein